MSKFDDLQALGRMLDEGEIDRDEYDRLKTDLMAEAGASDHPMKGKAPGWYKDPSGKASHQAFWDGEKWTGKTRSQFQANVADGRMKTKPADPRPFYQRGGFIVLVVIVLGLVIAGIVDSISNNSEDAGNQGGPTETIAPTGSSIDRYLDEYGGNRDVYVRIMGLSDCSALQQQFDIAANNNDREEPGTAAHRATLGYMTAADDRLESVGCYD